MSEELLTARDNELEIVKTAYFLEQNIVDLKIEAAKLAGNGHGPSTSYKTPPFEPHKPQLVEVHPNPPKYPEIVPPDYLFEKSREAIKKEKIPIYVALGIITMLFPLLLFAWIPILNRIWKHYDERAETEEKPIREAYINSVKNSDEYINACKEAEDSCRADYEQRKQAAEEKYNKELEIYNNRKKNYDEYIIPQYNIILAAIDNSEKALKEFYDTYRVIPAQYHNVSALAWIALYMHTSQYTLKDAIERWDEHVARCQRNRLIELSEAQLYVLEEQLKYQENTNWLNAQLVELSEKSNDILSSIGIWQKVYMLVNEYRYQKAKKQKSLNNK